VDVFLYFFEAKSPGKKLWVSFNGVVGRVLLTLFQQSYKRLQGEILQGSVQQERPYPLGWVSPLLGGEA